MVAVSGQQHILRKIDFNAMAFADGDGRRYLKELVENRGGRSGHTASGSIGELLRAGANEAATALRDLGGPGNDAESNRCSKNLQVVVIYDVLQPFFTNLVKPVELVRSTE